MISLALSILCSSAIFLLFRKFKDWKIDTFSAIVINYFVAGSFGLVISYSEISLEKLFFSNWSSNSFLLGIVFISLFYVMAKTAQEMGASVASIANKMALIIPVVFAVWLYGDNLNAIKISGIVLALFGIYFSSMKEKKGESSNSKIWILPLVIFVGSGFIDTFLKYTEEFYLEAGSSDSKLFSAMTFLTAFSIGIMITIIRKNKEILSRKNLISGLSLGLINYGSIYFLIQAFSESKWESSIIFPINNIGVVILTTFISFLYFKEEFSILNKVGVLISVIALLLISLSV